MLQTSITIDGCNFGEFVLLLSPLSEFPPLFVLPEDDEPPPGPGTSGVGGAAREQGAEERRREEECCKSVFHGEPPDQSDDLFFEPASF